MQTFQQLFNRLLKDIKVQASRTNLEAKARANKTEASQSDTANNQTSQEGEGRKARFRTEDNLEKEKKSYTFVKKQGVYEVNEEKNPIQQSLSFAEGKDFVSDSTEPYLQWEGSEAAKSDDNSITFKERLLSEDNTITFMGAPLTGAPIIQSADDVSFIFKNLQDASSENAFAVLQKDDGAYKVLYISSGSTSGVVVEHKAIVAASKEFGANSVTFVHNHPGGALVPSTQDISLHEKLKNTLKSIDVKLNESVIINLDSGNYATFDSEKTGERRIPSSSFNGASEIPVLRFDRQKLYIPSTEISPLKSPSDVASFLSKIKRGTTPSIGILILDRSNRPSRYSFVDETVSGESLTKTITEDIAQHGENAILSANYPIDKSFVESVNASLKRGGVGKILDVIVNKQSQDVLDSYQSFMEQGVRFRVGQTKTEAFKSWFGDWELNNKRVEIIPVETHRFKNNREAKQWAIENGIKGTFHNNTIGNYEISAAAIDKYLNNSSVDNSDSRELHHSVLRKLPLVIDNSFIGEKHPDYKKGKDGIRRIENGNNPGVSINRLFGAVKIDGKIYRVKTTVKAYRDKNQSSKPHTYEVTKIELIDRKPANAKDDTDPNIKNNSISAANLLQNVEKSYEKGKYLLDDVSKVVDGNGEPLVVYHGTNADFTEFKLSQDGGYHFGAEDQALDRGGKLMPVYLDIKNPMLTHDKMDGQKQTIKEAKKKGYDGLIYKNIFEGDGGYSYVAFSPTQIKSATDNTGAFDSENPDIRFRTESLSEPTYISPTEQALGKIEQEKGTAQQFKSMLLKNGAKQSELDWMGFDEHFGNGSKKVSKAEVQQWINENRIVVEEKVGVKLKVGVYEDVSDLFSDMAAHSESLIEERMEEREAEIREELEEQLDKDLAELEEQYEEDLEALENQEEDSDEDLAYEKNQLEESYLQDQGRLREEMEDKLNEYLYESEQYISIDAEAETRREFGITAPIYYGGSRDGFWIGDADELAVLMEANGSDFETEALKNLPEASMIGKHSEHTLPGGENYREILLTLPESKKKYEHSHFKVPNILAHVRTTDRTDTNAGKVLFIEEFQSDWAQEGRKEGFKGRPEQTDLPYPDYRDGLLKKYEVEKVEELIPKATAAEIGTLLETARKGDVRVDGVKPVADMPFKKTSQWLSLAIRRMMKLAADNGYNRIAWTTGEQQAERYNLGEKVDRIVVKEDNGVYGILVEQKGSGELTEAQDESGNPVKATKSNLADYIGKDMAKKAVEEGGGDFRGDDLRVGSGMIPFYNNIVPNAANKVGKPFDSKVEVIEIPGTGKQLSLPVTEKMREGVPLFRLGDIGPETLKKQTPIIKPVRSFKNINEAREYAKQHFQGKIYKNKDTGENIWVSRNGIDKTFNEKAVNQSSSIDKHLSAASVLDKVLQESILVEPTGDKKGDENIDKIQRYYGAVDINGEPLRVKTTVKRYVDGKEGNKFYTYEIQEMEVVSERPANGKGSFSQDPDTDTKSISMAKLLQNFDDAKSVRRFRTEESGRINKHQNAEAEAARQRLTAKRSSIDKDIKTSVEGILQELSAQDNIIPEVRFRTEEGGVSLANTTKLYKKAFGETTARVIREKMPVAFDFPSLFIPYLKDRIPVRSHMPFILNKMYGTIESDFLKVNEKKEVEVVKEKYDVERLLKDAGYEFNPTPTGDDVMEFRHYYPADGANGRSVICTYNNPHGRAKNYFITFIVKNDAKQTLPADKLTQENLSDSWKEYLKGKNRLNEDGTYNLDGLKRHREDPFSTSVLSVQIGKTGKDIKVISRYNHTINTGKTNPDAVHGNDLDKLVRGLHNSLFDYYKVSPIAKRESLPDNVIEDANNRYFHFSKEGNGVYWGDGFYYKNGEITLLDPSKEVMINGSVLNIKGEVDEVSGTIVFLGFLDIEGVQFKKKGRILINTKQGNIDFYVKDGQAGELVSADESLQNHLLQKMYGFDEKTNTIDKIDLGNNAIHLIWNDNIKHIQGDAFFMYSQVTDLGSLQSIGGEAYFGNSQLTDLGGLQSIGGSADFGYSQLTDLGGLQSIGGDAYFGNSQLTDLGSLQSIGGSAFFRGSQLTDLGGLQSIGGDAFFMYSQVTDLGSLQSIGGEADFRNSQLTDLGSLQSIGGDADFRNSQLTDLGSLQSIGGDAYFGNSQLTDLGGLQSIGGEADFRNSQLTDLGSLQSIGGDADFRNSQLTDLGSLQSIVGGADFRNMLELKALWEARKEDGLRFRTEESDRVNEVFNEELQRQIDGTLEKGHIYRLGHPLEFLRDAGLPDLPIELSSTLLKDKAKQDNHQFELSEVENLPDAIQNPIAVFESTAVPGRKVVFTELEHKGKNFVAALEIEAEKGDIFINDIRSVYPRENIKITKSFARGEAANIDKQKALDWISKQQSNSAEVTNLIKDATKVIEEFETAKEKQKKSEDNLLFRMEYADGNGAEAEAARQRLRAEINKLGYKLREGWQDMHLPVKTLFDELRRLGVKISSVDDFYQNVTALLGKNDFQLGHFQKVQGQRMLDAISDIIESREGKSRKEAYRNLSSYAMLKHGVERNARMREEEVKAYREKLTANLESKMKDWKKANPKATQEEIQGREDLEKARIEKKVLTRSESIREKDYSGIKAVEEEVGTSAQEYIESYEKEVGEERVKTLISIPQWYD